MLWPDSEGQDSNAPLALPLRTNTVVFPTLNGEGFQKGPGGLKWKIFKIGRSAEAFPGCSLLASQQAAPSSTDRLAACRGVEGWLWRQSRLSQYRAWQPGRILSSTMTGRISTEELAVRSISWLQRKILPGETWTELDAD
ncbi:hypothetical protein LIA77_03438 [Sarocladium implicatum]|nr:hypothetical protein LIA77_03438 [Sarocladium implicatum]